MLSFHTDTRYALTSYRGYYTANCNQNEKRKAVACNPGGGRDKQHTIRMSKSTQTHAAPKYTTFLKSRMFRRFRQGIRGERGTPLRL